MSFTIIVHSSLIYRLNKKDWGQAKALPEAISVNMLCRKGQTRVNF